MHRDGLRVTLAEAHLCGFPISPQSTFSDEWPASSQNGLQYLLQWLAVTFNEKGEVLQNAHNMRENTGSNGLDGLPNKFYLYMPNSFGDFLADIYHNSKNKGQYGFPRPS